MDSTSLVAGAEAPAERTLTYVAALITSILTLAYYIIRCCDQRISGKHFQKGLPHPHHLRGTVGTERWNTGILWHNYRV